MVNHQQLVKEVWPSAFCLGHKDCMWVIWIVPGFGYLGGSIWSETHAWEEAFNYVSKLMIEKLES